MAASITVRSDADAPAHFADRYVDLLTRADGRRLRDEELKGLRELAAAAADHGVALRTLVGECLTAACQAWPDIRETSKAADRDSLSEGPPSVLQAVRDATVALTEGYETAHRGAIRREEAMRREFVDDLLHGRTDLGKLAERAERFGLRLVGPHSVAVVRAATAFGAGDPATRYVEEGMAAAFGVHDVLITTKDGLLVCVSPATEADAPQRFATQVRSAGISGYQIAVSRPRPGPSGIVRSYQEARSTLDLADRLELTTPVVNASDLLVFQVLGRDRAAITDLVATVLGALERARGGPQPLLDTLTAYFASGCVNTTTARRLGLSVRAVTYRIARLRQLTGYDPADPDQRYTLHTATLGARLLGWPSRPLERADW
ncbi:helix-turn-helix domain-containing protein [Streptomyces sp. NPDC004647]|uniref:PucR family transcriptional regulator n=1 Tax=Streptomyces sp. NPDC004647 TaxID=3154671 RepID=UPI00339E6D18